MNREVEQAFTDVLWSEDSDNADSVAIVMTGEDPARTVAIVAAETSEQRRGQLADALRRLADQIDPSIGAQFVTGVAIEECAPHELVTSKKFRTTL